MQIKSISIRFTITLFILLISHVSYSHGNHENEDMLISELGDLGKVEFRVSCSAEAQKAINTGVSLLHHMMYAQAEKLLLKNYSLNGLIMNQVVR